MHLESTPTWLIGPEIPPTQRIGTVLSGSYRLDAFLGQGMTGVTYNAWHLRQKQPYAVKLLHRELQPSHERVSRLRQDLRTLSGLRRTGFLPVELSFAPDGAPFLASELLTGETLRSRLGRGALPVLATGIVTAALARALGEAHQQQIVHGDLRPENVLLPSEAGREVEAGQPVLLDAALHHLRRRPIGLDESLPLGKLVYLAPEQASGEQLTANVAGDIFALGAILYECLTGQQAFAAAEFEVVLEKLAAPPKKLVLPREVGAPPGLAEALDTVIAKACARDPEERYQTMAELLVALEKAFASCSLPLPPPDERVPIDTVKAQNRELRKRTVVVKKVVPLAPMAELPETSGVMSAAAFAHLNALMSSSTPEPSEPAATPATAAAEAGGDKAPGGRRITAKNRLIRRTVRAHDLSRLLSEVESGRLDAEQALALAAKADGEPDADDGVPEPVSDAKSAAQRIIEEGRAAVIARAEAAKKNRESDTKERQQREQVAAQEMQRRLLEQARQETLGRMRAEWEQSRPGRPKEADARPLARAASPADPRQAELLAEAKRQAQRLEAEHNEAERGAAEQAAKARAEAEAAEAGRKESARLEAELRAAERREAERAEAVRRQAEREVEARQLAEEAAKARELKRAEAEARHQEAAAARAAAEAKQREAVKAKQAIDSDSEAALWEDGIDLVVDDDKPDHTIPPPIPAAALLARTEAARRAEAEAQQAAAQATAAAQVAEKAQSDAAELEQQLVAARRAQEEAATARAREAAGLAEAVEAAEDVRAQDQALFRQVLEAEQRAKMAEAARVANVARMTRVTQALQVIRQVQTFADDEPAVADLASAATPTTTPAAAASSTSADTGKFRRPAGPPAGGERVESSGAPLSGEITSPTGLSLPAILKADAASHPGSAVSQPPARPESSGLYSAAPLASAAIRAPETSVPQSTQSPGLGGVSRTDLSTRHAAAPAATAGPRPDLSAGYSAAQLAAAGVRQEGGVGPTGVPSVSSGRPEPSGSGGRPDVSAAYSAAQLAAAGVHADVNPGHTGSQLPAPGARPDGNSGLSGAPPAALGARPDLSAGYSAAQMSAAGVRPDLSAGYTAAQMAAAGVRPDLSAGYTAAQLAAAGVRPDVSAGYTASQLAAAGVRPDLSAGYTAAQLAAAGILPQQPPMPSGMHPMARPDGDVSAMLSGAAVPALLPTGMVPMVSGAMATAQHPHEPGGITLTTRQLVAMLTMTSLLSGVIGALIALLVLQRVHPPVELGLAINGTRGAGGDITVPPPTPPVTPVPIPEVKNPPVRPVTTTAVTPAPTAVAAVAPPEPAAAGAVPATLVLHRAGVALPPLRLTSVAAVGPPRQSLWTRPGGAPAALARPPGAPAVPPVAKPDAAPADPESPAKKPVVETPPAKKPAVETPPTAAKPPVAKPPAAKPASAVQNGLRDPFAH